MPKSNARQLIFEVWEGNIDKTPKEIRDIVVEKLGKKKSKGGSYPGIRLVQLYISGFIAQYGKVVDEDKPWLISTLAQKEIPPESLPIVLEIFIEKLRDEATHMSIREAKWIGRLAFVLSDKENLWTAALHYAQTERVFRITGFDLNSFEEDIILLQDMIREKNRKSLSEDDITFLKEQESSALKKFKKYINQEIVKSREAKNERQS